MFLQDVVSKSTIVLDLKGTKKEEVIRELVDVLAQNKVLKNKEGFLNAVLERETLESTAIGDGLAIPHAKSDSAERIFCALGVKKEGLNFDSLDGKPVCIVFLVASPPDMNKEYIQIVAKAARLLKSKVMFEKILEAKSPEEVLKIIADFDRILQQSLQVKTKEGRIIHKDI